MVGAVLVTLATAAIAYIPVAVSTAGRGSIQFIGGVSLVAILLVAFAAWELRHRNPLMHLGILRRPALGTANIVTFLCSDRAGYITGQRLYVDGGMHRAL